MKAAGTVYLVGAGPGAASLITLRGADNAVLAEHKSFLWEQPAKQ